MATGVLIIGINQATRLLGHLALHDKAYDATIRLGVATTTDDADGEVVEERDATELAGEQVATAMQALTGEIDQVPSAVSAIKVDGVRAYKRVRDGEQVELQPRPVTVSAFDLVERRGADLDVRVECSTGTYVRALARDLGAALGVGAHLTALRRTRVGRFGIDQAHRLEELEANLVVIPIAEAATACFASLTISHDEATRVGYGQRLVLDIGDTTTALLDPDGALIALVERRNGAAQPLAVFAAATSQADLSS